MKTVIAFSSAVTVLVAAGTVATQSLEQVSATLFRGEFSSFQVVGDLAYGIGGMSLQIISVTDPANPVSTGGYVLPFNHEGIDVFISGDYAYLSWHEFTGSGNGLFILDISNRFEVTLTGSLNIQSGKIAVGGNYAYIAGDSSLQIIDISDPANPAIAGSCLTPDMGGAISLSGNFVYTTGNDLLIIDIDDPANPVLVQSYDTPGSAGGVFISADYAYVCWADQPDFGLEIIDVSDPRNPEFAGRYYLSIYATDVFVSGIYAYLADDDLQIIDISEPSNPVFISSRYTRDDTRYVSVSGDYAYAMSMAWSDDREYGMGGIEIIDVSIPSNPITIGDFSPAGTSSRVCIDDIYAYVADGYAGLQIVDISDPASPAIVGSLDPAGFDEYAFSITIADDYAYLGWGELTGWPDLYWIGRLEIIDISDPDQPIPIGSCQSYDRPIEVFVSGSYAYVIWYDYPNYRMDLIDVSNPPNPTINWSWHEVNDVFVSGNLAYMTRDTLGLQIADLSDPADPVILGYYDPSGVEFRGVYINGNYGYFAAGASGLYILDISDPSNPTFISAYDTQTNAMKVFVDGSYAYITESYSGLQIVDVSDPSNPTLAGGYDTPGIAKAVSAAGNYAYVVDGYSLTILRFDPQTGIIEGVNTPEQFSLAQNYPNPFNAATQITFSLPEPGDVKLVVYDLLGREVETLLDDYRPAGAHEVTFDASALASGVYFYRVCAGDMNESKSMLLLK